MCFFCCFQEPDVPEPVNSSLVKHDLQKQLPKTTETKGTKKNIDKIRLTKNDAVVSDPTSTLLLQPAMKVAGTEQTQVNVLFIMFSLLGGIISKFNFFRSF